MRDKGSITIYLALIMSILLSLIAAGLQSLKIAGARLEMVSAADLGLYSLFSQYDGDLLERYHLLFVDGSGEQGGLQMGQVFQRLKAGVSDNLQEAEAAGGSIIGYTLATDGNGTVFKEQVVEYMERTLGAHGVQLLLKQGLKEDEITAIQEKSRAQADSNEALTEYEQIKTEGTAAERLEDNEPSAPVEDFINPIEVIQDLKKMGILKLVLPPGATVSEKQISLTGVVSKRELQQGMGVIPSGDRNNSIQGNLLFQEYIVKYCDNYTTADGTGALAYQAEYILQGKDNDIANLKGVVNQLLLMRETVNLLHLLTDPGKKSQASSASLMIAAAVGMPQMQPALEKILMLCWAYGESILDVKELLAGGKVALIKDADSWQLSLENLAHLADGLDGLRRGSEHGLDYQSYLRILLALNKDDKNVMRCMDIVELNMNSGEGRNNFRLDCCIASLEAELKMSISGQQFNVIRSYGYDM